ncbi:MAG: hypothetical protein SFX74_04425 [Fimbriimonadaceae bacterium]|nr:hypothetical protein [Fimbriimonadaceae bacterium]
MSFAWYGIHLRVQDDWAPVAVSGDRTRGYVRLGSTTAYQVQMRWEVVRRAPDLEQVIARYLDGHGKDARRKKIEFERDVHALDDCRTSYRYQGVSSGRGVAQYHPGRKLVIWSEVVGQAGDSLVSAAQRHLGIRDIDDGDTWSWRVLGLDCRIPREFELTKRRFVAGRTGLDFRLGPCDLSVDRWGMAASLMAKQPVEEWARAVLAAPRASVTAHDHGLELNESRWFGFQWMTAMVTADAERNQLTTLQLRGSGKRTEASWDWLIR